MTDLPLLPELPGQLRLVDPCDGPGCPDLPCATARIGPVPDDLCAHLPGARHPVDRCLRLRVCPEHVTPFVDRATVHVAGVELPLSLRWDR